MERVCLFKRKQRGTIVVAVLFLPSCGVVFAPVLRPAPLNESETIAETAPKGSRFFLRGSKLLFVPVQEKIMPA